MKKQHSEIKYYVIFILEGKINKNLIIQIEPFRKKFFLF